MSATTPAVDTTQAAPRSVSGILARLGPGLIIAASIVGSGELIGTTKTGAEAGFSLLWLIVLGCVIKVFAQVEFGRYALTAGQTTLAALNEVPGPRLRVNWLMWYWLLMFALGFGQLGGIVGSVGQAMALSFPLTGDLARQIEAEKEYAQSPRHALGRAPVAGAPAPPTPPAGSYTWDDVWWSVLITAATSVMLVWGRYALIQNVATALVAGFTVTTVVTVLALRSRPEWAITWSDLAEGFRFGLPPASEKSSPLTTALSSFGIIGVGASELIAYPYWCLEKGYARYTGQRTADAGWAERARGWLRVMQWDVWCSMLIYTFATVAFYLLGAAVLFRAHLVPGDSHLIPTLIEMYSPVFGGWASPIFLCGAFAVLYSTFFVASAGNARMAADALRVFGLRRDAATSGDRWTRGFCGLFPVISLVIYLASKLPVTLVLISGMAQSIMLPMLGGAALYFRFRRCDARLQPGRWWDAGLWLSVAGLLLAGAWGAWLAAGKLLASWH